MVRISKKDNAIALAKAGIPRKSWTKLEFCARNGISEGLYDKMKKLGVGPDESYALDRVLITIDAENQWLRKGKRKADKAVSAESADA